MVLFMAGEDQLHPAATDVGRHPRADQPAILAVATFLIAFAVLLLLTVDWLRRRGEPAGGGA